MNVIQPHELRHVWPRVVDWINEAVKQNQGDEELLDVLIALARGQYLLFHEPGAYAAIVSIAQYPAQKVGTIVYLGGKGIEDLRRGFEDGKTWGRANGVNVVRTYGRPGWAKLMGLKQVGVILQDTL